MIIHKAKSPDITKYRLGEHLYSIYDAFVNAQSAKAAARDLGTQAGRIHQYNRTLAIVVDLGKEAGRLRYAVFTAKGAKI